MSSNSGTRGTPLKTSDDEAELSPDSQIIEEEAGLSPISQNTGYGLADARLFLSWSKGTKTSIEKAEKT